MSISRNGGARDQNFFGRTGKRSSFQRGDFKYVVLNCIKDKPSYGYEIIQMIREHFYNFYIPSSGSVYPILHTFVEMGYAQTAELEDKKVYAITEEGRKYLDSQKEFMARMQGQDRAFGNDEKRGNVIETRHQFEKLTRLLRTKVNIADAEKLDRIQKALYNAYEEISKD